MGEKADTWNWARRRERGAFLALEDGTVMRGVSVGAPVDREGEVVFNTGMTGYQEILSDPSYAGQIVTLTYPEIGNTGMNAADMESGRLFANGLLVHAENPRSSWRGEEELREALERGGIPAIAGIDTRALTVKLRSTGTLKGYLSVTGAVSEEGALRRAREWEGLDNQDYASRVTCSRAYEWDPEGVLSGAWGAAESLPPADFRVVAVDYGLKWNIARGLRRNGMGVRVVPAGTTAEEILAMSPDGVFISNGPADPAALDYAAETVRGLLGRLPLMGICLGHQLLGLALGARTYRLKFGHHGCNHPVREEATGRVRITSQNHNFAVDSDTLDSGEVEITHINLNDRTIEGMRCRNVPAFSMQYHPEAAPGPHDALDLFARFREMIAENA